MVAAGNIVTELYAFTIPVLCAVGETVSYGVSCDCDFCVQGVRSLCCRVSPWPLMKLLKCMSACIRIVKSVGGEGARRGGGWPREYK